MPTEQSRKAQNLLPATHLSKFWPKGGVSRKEELKANAKPPMKGIS